jgi:hypothetical protein
LCSLQHSEAKVGADWEGAGEQTYVVTLCLT